MTVKNEVKRERVLSIDSISRVRSIYSEIAWSTVAHIATTALTILVGLLLARHYSIHEYGQLVYFLNLFGIFRMIAAFGLTSGIIIELSRCRVAGESVNQQFYSLFSIRIIISAILGGGAAIIGCVLADTILIAAGVAAATALMSDFFVGALRGLDAIRQATIAQALQPAIYSLGAALIAVRNFPISALYLALIASFVISSIFPSVLLLIQIGMPTNRSFQYTGIGRPLRASAGMYTLFISGTIFTSCVPVLLGLQSRFEDAARLSIPLYLALLPTTLVSSALAGVYFPKLVTMYTQHAQKDAQILFGWFFEITAALTIPVSVAFGLFPHIVLFVLYGQRYQESAVYLVMMAPSALLYTSFNVMITTVASSGRVNRSIVASCISIVIMMIFVLAYLIYSFGLAFVVLSYTIAILGGFIWLCYVTRSEWNIPYNKLIRYFVMVIMLFAPLRLLFSDEVNYIVLKIILLGVVSGGYIIWIWHAKINQLTRNMR